MGAEKSFFQIIHYCQLCLLIVIDRCANFFLKSLGWIPRKRTAWSFEPDLWKKHSCWGQNIFSKYSPLSFLFTYSTLKFNKSPWGGFREQGIKVLDLIQGKNTLFIIGAFWEYSLVSPLFTYICLSLYKISKKILNVDSGNKAYEVLE